MSLRRDLLTSVRRRVWRAAFWADFVLAIEFSFPAAHGSASLKNKGPGLRPSLAGAAYRPVGRKASTAAGVILPDRAHELADALRRFQARAGQHDHGRLTGLNDAAPDEFCERRGGDNRGW